MTDRGLPAMVPIRNVRSYALRVPALDRLDVQPGEVIDAPIDVAWSLCRGGLAEDAPPMPSADAAFEMVTEEGRAVFRALELRERRRLLGISEAERKRSGYVVRCPRCNAWLVKTDDRRHIVETSSKCDGLIRGSAAETHDDVMADGDGVRCRCGGGVDRLRFARGGPPHRSA